MVRAMGTTTLLAALVAGGALLACKKSDTTETPAAAWKAGDKVDIEWKGSWWQGEVLEVKDGKYKVHYTGWSNSWDEWVGSERLRAPSGTAQVGTEKT
jgi:hypothetical protein